jgi:hypothetical protein
VVQEVDESPPNTRRSLPSQNGDPPLCATFLTFGGVGELYQRRSVIATLRRPPAHQDWGRAGTTGNRFARGDKEVGPPAGGNNYPGNGLVKPPRRDTKNGTLVHSSTALRAEVGLVVLFVLILRAQLQPAEL